MGKMRCGADGRLDGKADNFTESSAALRAYAREAHNPLAMATDFKDRHLITLIDRIAAHAA
jgi:hypothetical protein